MQVHDLIIKHPTKGSMVCIYVYKNLNNKICTMCMKTSKAVDLIYNNYGSEPNT